MSKSTWDIVATIDEHPALIRTLVAWHLALGARHVYLFCDRGDDPVGVLFDHLRQVTVVNCDAAYWRASGLERPARLVDRQLHNATAAYTQSKSDWIVHIDADEYLWAPRSVGETLGALSQGIDGAVVPVAERMHRPQDKGLSVFEGGFRRPFHGLGRDGRARFGRAFHMTYKGLAAHAQGKTFVRTARALTLSVHRARPKIAGDAVNHLRLDPDQIEVLHFDGLTPLHWRYKLARMAASYAQGGGAAIPQHRQRQIAALQKENAGLYPRLKGPDAALQDGLHAHGLWAAPPFDPLPALQAWFPDQTSALTPEAFDRWLLAREDPALSSE